MSGNTFQSIQNLTQVQAALQVPAQPLVGTRRKSPESRDRDPSIMKKAKSQQPEK
jgi:hypothetical protein